MLRNMDMTDKRLMEGMDIDGTWWWRRIHVGSKQLRLKIFWVEMWKEVFKEMWENKIDSCHIQSRHSLPHAWDTQL